MEWIGELPEKGSDLALLLSFLASVVVQIWREFLARRDRRQEKAEAAQREGRIQESLRLQHAETRKLVNERLDAMRKRLNGLLEDDEEGFQHGRSD